MSIKRPASQFYWHEHFSDARLRRCSLAARGLWMDMQCLMHQGEPYGHLAFEGRALDDRELARLVGEDRRHVTRWREELERNGVYSRDNHGRIFSRRMVRDEVLRNARAAGGQAGAPHGPKGASHGAKGGRPRKETPLADAGTGVLEPPIKPAPSSSSSSSSSKPKPNGSRRSPLVPLPDDFGLTERTRKVAREKAIGEDELQECLANFIDWAKGSGMVKADWEATFCAALRKGWCRPTAPKPSAEDVVKQAVNLYEQGEVH